MLARVLSGAVLGVDAYLVVVESDVASGLPSFSTVGLPQGAVKEGKERVIAVMQNSGYHVPPKRITINLAPADRPKQGSAFDLPVAVGILASTGQMDSVARLERHALLGELALDGGLRPVRGALAVALAAKEAGLAGLIVPEENVAEAAVVDGLEVRGAATLEQVVRFLEGAEVPPARIDRDALFRQAAEYDVDFADVKGQEHVKRALEVAAAGAHNILMIGPPGSGKTMLARRIPTILPPLTLDEALETTKIHSVAGLLGAGHSLIATRPYRSPHHTISDAGLIGGGSNPRPGEVSLAHHGVLFMDELPEFRRNVLEVLRQPMEDSEVTIARAAVSLTYPARVMLVAAMNPCPCGHYGDSSGKPCTCGPIAVQRYMSRVSGPLLDRIDLHVEVPALRYRDLSDGRSGEPSAAVRERVTRARERQRARFGGRARVHANAHMTPRDLREHCRVGEGSDALLRTAITRLGLSARAYHRVLKIARTIADLAAEDEISTAHVSEAIQYRSLDRSAAHA